MNPSYKAVGITALIALIVGLCAGFIPEHMNSSNQQDQIAALTKGKADVQSQFSQAQNVIALQGFTIKAAMMSADAEQNNYSVASNEASGLFTGLREYIDQTQNSQIKQQFGEILGERDKTIAALAKADPAIKPLLQEIFRKLQGVYMQTN